MSFEQTYTREFVRQFLKKKENAIRSSLPEGQTLEQLQDRMEVIDRIDGMQTFCLDGQPVIEFFPPEFSMVRDGDTFKIIGTQNVRTFDYGSEN